VNNIVYTDRPVRTSRTECAQPADLNRWEPGRGAEERPVDADGADGRCGRAGVGDVERLGNTEEHVPAYLEAMQDMTRVAVTFGWGTTFAVTILGCAGTSAYACARRPVRRGGRGMA